MQIDGSGRVHLVQSMPVLRPDEQVLQMMLDGWRNQQLSRNLQFATIEQRLRCVQRLVCKTSARASGHSRFGAKFILRSNVNADHKAPVLRAAAGL